MKNDKTPKIRFEGFDDDWEQRKLGDVAKYRNGKAHESCIDENGKYVVVNSKFVSTDGNVRKFSNIQNEPLLENEIAFVLSDVPNGRAIARTFLVEESDKYTLNQRIAGITPLEETYPYFLHILMNRHPYFLAFDDGAKQTNLSVEDVMKFEACYPDFMEQRKIGEYFRNLDHLITLHQRKYDKLQMIKKSMLEKMFPQNGENKPEIRFEEFNDDWEQRKLEDMCSIITKQTGFDYSATIKPSLVTTKEEDTYSFIQNKDFEGTNINLDTDFYIPISVAKKYPKITLDQPSLLISISGRIGNVGLYSLDSKAFIGGAVGICKLKDIEDGKTALYELLAPSGQKYFNSLIKASSHANITVEDIRNIEILLPKSKEEKKKLNRCFGNLDNLITLHQRKLGKMKNIKRSMLEKMFI